MTLASTIEPGYWAAQLSGDLPSTKIPTDFPRPPVASFIRGVVELALGKAVRQRLLEGAKALGVSPFAVALSAWEALLHRYSLEEDLLVGTLAAWLPPGPGKRMVADPVPIRVQLESEDTGAELLRKTVSALAAAAVHPQPFDGLELKLSTHNTRRRDGTSLFPTMVLPGDLESPLWLREIEPGLDDTSDGQAARCDLVARFTLPGDDLMLTLEFDEALYRPETIKRLARHFGTILVDLLEHPERPINSLRLSTAEEIAKFTFEAAKAVLAFPPGLTVADRFEEQVRRDPDAIALSFGGVTLSYRDLDREANGIANTLQTFGVGAETVVALYLERSHDLVIAILGVHKAGGAYLPIDLSYPSDRVSFMLEDADARVILTQSHLVQELPPSNATVVSIDTEGVKAPADEGPTREITPESLAYIIYTSGSTGRPKGVLVTHYNMVRLFQATDRWFSFSADDVWTLFHSYGFDFSVWEIWGALLYGGRVVVVPHVVSRSPDAFLGLLETERVTVLNQTPSAFRQLIEASEAAGSPPLALRLVILGGEALELPSLKPWFDRRGDQCPQLVNMYGITETTVHVTYRPITIADLDAGLGSVIGVPLPDLSAYVLDQAGQPVPVGVPGELYIGGAGVARGYLNRPELTAARFVHDPVHDGPGRLYRTGDVVRRLPTGELEYRGRADAQVKIRGFRIELGEIEAALATLPQVRQAAVIVREDDPGEGRLVAYVVQPNNRLSVRDIRKALDRVLPQYMIPTAFIEMEHLPLTSNGKLDRHALPQPNHTRPDITSDYRAPETPAQELLAELWADALRLERVGMDDNFFELGGDSIMCVDVARRLQQALKRDVSVVALFEYPTIRTLARHLDRPGKESPPAGDERDRARKQRAALGRRRPGRTQ